MSLHNLAKIKENLTKEQLRSSLKKRKKAVAVAVAVKIALSAALILLTFLGSHKAKAAYGLPLSYRQVKVAGSKAVYYLDHAQGKKKAYINEKAFLSYGNRWKDVKTISQKELVKWPDVRLVKTASSPAVYYISGDKKTLIKNESDFQAFGFKDKDIVKISPADLASYLTADYRQAGLSYGIANEEDGGRVSVRLSEKNPRAGFLPMRSRNNQVLSFILQGSQKDTSIRRIDLQADGFYDSNNIDFYLTDGDYPLDAPATIGPKSVSFNFGADPLVIKAGEEKTIDVFLNLGAGDSSGRSVRLSLPAAGSFFTDGEVGGDFPLLGNQFKFADGAVLGQAQAEELPASSSDQPLTGTTDQIIGKFRLSEASGQEDMAVESLWFVNQGTARNEDLLNLRLLDSKNQILARSALAENNFILFRLNDLKIKAGSSADFTIMADIDGNEERTININLQDGYFEGATYGYGLPLVNSVLNDEVKIARRPLVVLSRDGKSNKSFDTPAVAIANFQIRNNGQKLILDSLGFALEKGDGTPALQKDLLLADADTGQIISQAAVLSGELKFNGYGDLSGKKEFNFSLLAEIPDAAKNDDFYQAALTRITYRGENGLTYQDDLDVKGAPFRVGRSNLYIYPNNNEAEATFTKGQKGVKIASFILEASSGEDVKISSLTFARGADVTAPILYSEGFSDLKIYLGGSGARTRIDQPSGTTYTFDNLNYRLRAGNRIEVKILADTDSDLSVSETQLALVQAVASSYDSGLATAINGLNTSSRKTRFGGLGVKLDTLSGGVVLAGSNNNQVGSFSVTNSGSEDIRLRNLTVMTSSDGFSNSLGYGRLSVRTGNGNSLGTIYHPVAGGNTIDLGRFLLAAGQTANFNLYVDADRDVPQKDFKIFFAELEAEGRNSGIKILIGGDTVIGADVQVRPAPEAPTSGNSSLSGSHNSSNNNNSSSSNSSGSNSSSTAVELHWPTSSHSVSYGFHDPAYPFRSTGEHEGIDIVTDQGNPVYAAAAGTVTAMHIAATMSEYTYVMIDHGNGLSTVYGHLSRVDVRIGDSVSAGQRIGLSGGQPGTLGAGDYSTGPHLHFEVRSDGTPVDPRNYLR